MRVEATFESPVFDKQIREQELENFVGRQAKDFKVLTKQRMIDGPASGILYARKRGEGFRRFHRASARGERPAPDTGTLVNSVDDRQISPTEAETFAEAPYAEFLQSPRLERPIMDERDAEEAEAKMLHEANDLILKLI